MTPEQKQLYSRVRAPNQQGQTNFQRLPVVNHTGQPIQQNQRFQQVQRIPEISRSLNLQNLQKFHEFRNQQNQGSRGCKDPNCKCHQRQKQEQVQGQIRQMQVNQNQEVKKGLPENVIKVPVSDFSPKPTKNPSSG